MKKYLRIFAVSVALITCACRQTESALPDVGGVTDTEFASPGIRWRPVPLWFWNNTEVDRGGVSHQLRRMVEQDMYGGCAILPFGRDFRPEYLSDDYMDLYAYAVSVADSLGAQMSLYDEYGFPSGSMGAINGDGVTRFKNAHPGRTVKRLDKHEIALEPGKTAELDLNSVDGKIMAIAAYDAVSHKSESVSEFIKDGLLRWTSPLQGRWKLMIFNCVEDGDPNVDYLDADAVRLFTEDTHERYRSVLGDAIGSTVTSTFFDEPTMYRAQGRMWTESFNDEFRSRFGMAPDAFYPALWYDIGESTPAARNMMFGLRSSLYAEGFMKTVAEWAEDHGIASTGHQDQEEIANTTSVSGDLMLDGKYMTMPGIDKIGGDRPAELYYKVVSSSAQNWDKTEVMSETFGAMGNIPVREMYRTAVEQYTKGITNLIPHAVWYDDSKVTFLPELSWRNPLYNSELPAFNTFLARLRYMLARPGRHVADIAVLYPVQTQYAGHHLDGALGYYKGGVEVEGTDYPEISRILTNELGRDFTYIHPEVLDGRCTVTRDGLTMENNVNREQFKAIVLPGVKTISFSNLKQVMKAWRRGVKVVFTTVTPCQSADYATDNATVCRMVARMLKHSGGKRSAVFIEDPDAASLAEALNGLCPDVEFTGANPFNYIHKVFSYGDVFYIGNIGSDNCRNEISLRGEFRNLRLMDPHTGECRDAACTISDGRTIVTLELAPDRSVVLYSER